MSKVLTRIGRGTCPHSNPTQPTGKENQANDPNLSLILVLTIASSFSSGTAPGKSLLLYKTATGTPSKFTWWGGGSMRRHGVRQVVFYTKRQPLRPACAKTGFPGDCSCKPNNSPSQPPAINYTIQQWQKKSADMEPCSLRGLMCEGGRGVRAGVLALSRWRCTSTALFGERPCRECEDR